MFEVLDCLAPRAGNSALYIIPLSAEVTDIVCVFHGSCIPFILRPCENTEGAFRSVGKCYMHKIIEEEAMQTKDSVKMESDLI